MGHRALSDSPKVHDPGGHGDATYFITCFLPSVISEIAAETGASVIDLSTVLGDSEGMGTGCGSIHPNCVGHGALVPHIMRGMFTDSQMKKDRTRAAKLATAELVETGKERAPAPHAAVTAPAAKTVHAKSATVVKAERLAARLQEAAGKIGDLGAPSVDQDV